MAKQTSGDSVTRSDEGETLEQLWEARNLPASLLARARSLDISDGQLARLLAWNAPQERIEEEIEWTDRLRNGSMRFRQLTIADDAAFRQLWANSPETIGEWDVTVERGEDATNTMSGGSDCLPGQWGDARLSAPSWRPA